MKTAQSEIWAEDFSESGKGSTNRFKTNMGQGNGPTLFGSTFQPTDDSVPCLSKKFSMMPLDRIENSQMT